MLTCADVCWHLNYSQPWKDPVILQHFDLRAAGVVLTYADVCCCSISTVAPQV